MKYLFFFVCLTGLLSTSCALAPYPQEKATLEQAIVGAACAISQAEIDIPKNGCKTYNMRPSKATVSFDLSTIRGEGNTAQISVSTPSVPVTGGFGWSATKQIQQGSHIVIEFTPKH